METKSKTLEIAKSMVKWEDELSYRTEVNGGLHPDNIYRCTVTTCIGNYRLSLKQRTFINALILKEKTFKSCETYGMTAYIDGYSITFKYGHLSVELIKRCEGEEAFLKLKKFGYIK